MLKLMLKLMLYVNADANVHANSIADVNAVAKNNAAILFLD